MNLILVVFLCFSTASAIIVSSTQPVPFCNPKAPPPCIDKKFGFCINDYDYPMDDIQTTIDESESVKKFINKTITNRRRAIKKKDTGCQTTNLLVKPLRLRNIDRDWLVIVQDTNDIFQREEIAICSHPNVPCRHNISSRSAYCHQKYSTRKLLAFDPCNPVRGVYVESFKLQSACDCRL
ncbi:uncharacterized protein LOC124350789 isoform X2 [Daphnia pulicaria]|uniref:uncharacterized protein LOC124350789 isoform X2 n=1 Tax=Daphnia pulicaria TaxID=35523 RepID=UPI001EEC45B4|nr:uncharacterized protein LOC124350789 isoform X2 [Daphnia pulicaria]